MKQEDEDTVTDTDTDSGGSDGDLPPPVTLRGASRAQKKLRKERRRRDPAKSGEETPRRTSDGVEHVAAELEQVSLSAGLLATPSNTAVGGVSTPAGGGGDDGVGGDAAAAAEEGDGGDQDTCRHQETAASTPPARTDSVGRASPVERGTTGSLLSEIETVKMQMHPPYYPGSEPVHQLLRRVELEGSRPGSKLEDPLTTTATRTWTYEESPSHTRQTITDDARSTISSASSALLEVKTGASSSVFLVELIGRGSSGEVWKVRDRDGKLYALKRVVVSLASMDSMNNVFFEVKLVREVMENPNVLRFYNWFMVDHETENFAYFCMLMELCDKGTLKKVINEARAARTHFPEESVTKWFRQMTEALHAFHRKGLVHRDLKPANVLLTIDDDIRIGDFGTARFMNGGRCTDSIVGTEMFFSPEILAMRRAQREEREGMHYDDKIDIWGMGCVLYCLVTLEQTCFAQEFLDRADAVDFFRGRLRNANNGAYSTDLTDAILWCLTPDPDRRPSAAELWQSKVIENDKRAKSWKDTFSAHKTMRPVSPPRRDVNMMVDPREHLESLAFDFYINRIDPPSEARVSGGSLIYWEMDWIMPAVPQGGTDDIDFQNWLTDPYHWGKRLAALAYVIRMKDESFFDTIVTSIHNQPDFILYYYFLALLAIRKKLKASERARSIEALKDMQSTCTKSPSLQMQLSHLISKLDSGKKANSFSQSRGSARRNLSMDSRPLMAGVVPARSPTRAAEESTAVVPGWMDEHNRRHRKANSQQIGGLELSPQSGSERPVATMMPTPLMRPPTS